MCGFPFKPVKVCSITASRKERFLFLQESEWPIVPLILLEFSFRDLSDFSTMFLSCPKDQIFFKLIFSLKICYKSNTLNETQSHSVLNHTIKWGCNDQSCNGGLHDKSHPAVYLIMCITWCKTLEWNWKQALIVDLILVLRAPHCQLDCCPPISTRGLIPILIRCAEFYCSLTSQNDSNILLVFSCVLCLFLHPSVSAGRDCCVTHIFLGRYTTNIYLPG